MTKYSTEVLHGVRPAKPGQVAAHDADWTVLPADTPKRCRWGGNKPCGRRAVAEMDRGRWPWSKRRPDWWAYCERHLYGRWVKGNEVMEWATPEDDS